MKIAIIAAMTAANVIGSAGHLPWRIKDELKYFRAKTLGKPIIMGSNTFRSIDMMPLSGRCNIVVTSTPMQLVANAKSILKQQQQLEKLKDLVCVSSITAAILQAEQFYANSQATMSTPEIMVIGGEKIYRQFLPLANRMYLSTIHQNYSGDVYFPQYNMSEWNLISTVYHEEFTSKILDRIAINPL